MTSMGEVTICAGVPSATVILKEKEDNLHRNPPGQMTSMEGCWKNVLSLNDCKPITFIPLLAKSTEHLMSKELSKWIHMQFAYQASCGVEDATLTLLDKIGKANIHMCMLYGFFLG